MEVALGGEGHAVSIDADDNLLPELRSESDGKRLAIDAARALKPSRRIHVTVEAPDIALLRCHGSIDARVRGIRDARFQIDLLGSGSVEASGSTQKLKVYLKGSGAAHLEKLAIEEALVDVDGSGSADIAAPKHLEAEIHGSGAVTYEGTPVIEQTVRGAGKLSHR